MAYIIAKHLKYRYPHQDGLALNDLSFSIHKGEFIGVIGANGAGKSTLAGAFVGLVPHFYKGAYGGSITINEGEGLEVSKHPVAELCQKVGLVFQNPFNQLTGARDTVMEEIAFGLQNMGIAAEEIKKRVAAAMKRLGIDHLGERNPFDLSGGQMQRVALASILVMEPGILVLDEPTSQLDPAAGEEVFRAIEALKQSGITIIMAEQKMEKLAAYCDRILLLHEGRQVAFDRPEIIFARSDLLELGICPPLSYLIRQKGPDILSGFGWKRRGGGPRAAETVFAIHKLSFSYTSGLPVLQELELGLDNRPAAIVGQNGAGKTTLVKLLKGLLTPVSGSIFYCGEDISRRTVAMLARDVGYVFQNPDDQIFKYRVLDEVMFGPLNIGMDTARAREQAVKALELTGLAGKENSNPYDLELPDRKMVSIASVLAMDTKVIILDEPTIAQDYRGRERLKQIIRALEDAGKTVIAILHDMDFVYDCFERVIVLAGGRIIGDGTGREIFRNAGLLEQAGLEPPAVLQYLPD